MEECGKAGAMPQKCERAEKLGQCPRNVKGVKSWGNAPEIEKRQMIGNEEEYAPVVRRFSFLQKYIVHKLAHIYPGIFQTNYCFSIHIFL